jgi:hypothetical protein
MTVLDIRYRTQVAHGYVRFVVVRIAAGDYVIYEQRTREPDGWYTILSTGEAAGPTEWGAIRIANEKARKEIGEQPESTDAGEWHYAKGITNWQRADDQPIART